MFLNFKISFRNSPSGGRWNGRRNWQNSHGNEPWEIVLNLEFSQIKLEIFQWVGKKQLWGAASWGGVGVWHIKIKTSSTKPASLKYHASLLYSSQREIDSMLLSITNVMLAIVQGSGERRIFLLPQYKQWNVIGVFSLENEQNLHTVHL